MDRAARAPIVELSGIGKSFPGVRALNEARRDLHRSEVVALMGENGAGKSTLMKILTGVYQPDQGETLPEVIDTGFYWYDKTNMNDPQVSAVLYD